MKWLEIITLRCTGRDRFDAALEVLEQMTRADRADDLVASHFYRNSEVESDLSIHFLWSSMKSSPDKSSLGSRLAHVLREFGFIHHAIWIEGRPVSPA